MLNIYASYGCKETGNWESLEVIPLKPYEELYPDQEAQGNEGFGINNYPLKLPNGEIVYLGMAFTTMNNRLNFIVEDDTDTLVNVGTSKPHLESFDPSILVRTIGGLHLSFMFTAVGAISTA